MSDRPRSAPPELPNFTYEKWLGGGGFADVFLYRQHRPTRPVAIKVLRADGLPAEARAAFDAEADLMAQVSAHPYIVSIYDTAVAPDGRPYLVMQYYPNPHYGQRARGGLDVAEALAVGVRIASAVETAHRVGILHRDIKPANILVSEYNRPGLTDFGIAGTREGSGSGAQGVTYAYAPPEILATDDPGDERADVYSLAATLYALLAGRAPFEVPGGDNSTRAIAVRTLNDPVPPVEKLDVPQSLELLLQHALAKRSADRPASAAAFARALQSIEQELRLAPTEFELAEVTPTSSRDAVSSREDDDDDATRSGRLQIVRPEPAPIVAPAPVRGYSPLPVPEPPEPEDTVHRAANATGGTLASPSRDAPSASPIAADAGRRRPAAAPIVAGVLLLLVAVAVVVGALGSRGDAGNAAPTTTLPGDDALEVIAAPSTPSDVAVAFAEGVATVTWSVTGAQEGDTYLLARVDGRHRATAPLQTSETTARIEGIPAGDVPCFEVSASRGGVLSEPSPRACAP